MTASKNPQIDPAQDGSDDLREGLQRLVREDRPPPMRLGSRLRNWFLTGLVIVGPVTLTAYIAWWFVNWVDAWMKPFIPSGYLPEIDIPYIDFPYDIPGIGLLFAALLLTLIGALAANLLGRSLIRNVYGALKQIFESVVSASSPDQNFQKVGMIEFPSKGLWSIVFVTGEASGEVAAVKPGGQSDLVSVFMPTGIVPPTGFVCFVPRKDVIFLSLSIEDAAKIVISGGMVMPGTQEKLKELARNQGMTL
jgi:uncharacterized membrane protein